MDQSDRLLTSRPCTHLTRTHLALEALFAGCEAVQAPRLQIWGVGWARIRACVPAAAQEALGEALEALEDSGEMAEAAEAVREGVEQQAVLLERLQARLEEAHQQQARSAACPTCPTGAALEA